MFLQFVSQKLMKEYLIGQRLRRNAWYWLVRFPNWLEVVIEANCLELPDQIQENAVRLTCLLTIKALKYSLSPRRQDGWGGGPGPPPSRGGCRIGISSIGIGGYRNIRRLGRTVVRCSTILWLDQRVGEDGGEAGDVVGSLQSSTISWSGTRLSWKKYRWLWEWFKSRVRSDQSKSSLTRLSISLVGMGSASLSFLVNLFTPHNSNTVLNRIEWNPSVANSMTHISHFVDLDAVSSSHLSPRVPRTREVRIRTKQKRPVRKALKYQKYRFSSLRSTPLQSGPCWRFFPGRKLQGHSPPGTRARCSARCPRTASMTSSPPSRPCCPHPRPPPPWTRLELAALECLACFHYSWNVQLLQLKICGSFAVKICTPVISKQLPQDCGRNPPNLEVVNKEHVEDEIFHLKTRFGHRICKFNRSGKQISN